MDLIDRKKPLEIYKNWIPQLSLPEDEKDRHAVETCIAVLEDVPAVDAVPVVRCRECIGESTWLKNPENGREMCGMSGMYPKGEDGFCSYGKPRKERK